MPPTSTVKPPTPFARRMRAAREATGLPLDVIAVDARRLVGSSFGPSRESIRRLEDGFTSEDRANPVFIAALADIYGVSLEELSPLAAEQMRNVHLLVSRVLSDSSGSASKSASTQSRRASTPRSTRPSSARRKTSSYNSPASPAETGFGVAGVAGVVASSSSPKARRAGLPAGRRAIA